MNMGRNMVSRIRPWNICCVHSELWDEIKQSAIPLYDINDLYHNVIPREGLVDAVNNGRRRVVQSGTFPN